MSALPHKQHGFSLIELMVAVAVLAIVASIAIPAYNGYVATARQAEGADDLATLRLAQLEFLDENGAFFQGANTQQLVANSGGRWQPSDWDPGLTPAQNMAALNFMYVVVPGATGNIASSYTATATGQNDVLATVVLTATN